MANTNIQEIKNGSLRWINITHISEIEIKYLEENFHFHSLHLKDCLSLSQRPRIEKERDYIFIALLFPVYKRKERKIISAEVDFFISNDFLITVHRNELAPLINFFNLCQVSQSQRAKYLKDSPANLLYTILKILLDSCLPILDTLNKNISNIEDQIFKGYERRMVKEILLTKRSIICFSQTMQIHRLIMKRLIRISDEFFSLGHLKLYFKELLESSEEIWAALENLSKTISTIEQTNNSLISFRLNDIIKILTIISVTILPVTLTASILSMNVPGSPLRSNPHAFPIIISIMALIFLLTLSIFKSKRWL